MNISVHDHVSSLGQRETLSSNSVNVLLEHSKFL